MPTIPALFAALLPILADTLPDVTAFSLSDTAVGQIMDDPTHYLNDMTDLIAAYGADGAITAEQVDTSIALQQAKARSSAMALLIAGDLNCDDVLTGDELRRSKAAVSASARVKVQRAFGAADADGDGQVSGRELTAFGMSVANKAVSPTAITMTKLVMAFDDDTNGQVTLAEMRAGLAF